LTSERTNQTNPEDSTDKPENSVDDITSDVHGEGDESVVSDKEGKEVYIVDENTKLLY
jgi:hypothetical protein